MPLADTAVSDVTTLASSVTVCCLQGVASFGG